MNIGKAPGFVLATAIAALCATGAHGADELDWSVGLRGSYSSSDVSGGRFEAVVAPEVSVTFGGEGGTLTLGSGGELAVDAAGNARFADMHGSADGSYQIDPDSSLAGTARLSLTQDGPDNPSAPTNTAIAPLVFSGTAEGRGTTRIGPLDVTARVGGGRYLVGDETLYDATIIDHAPSSYWRDEAGLRVGFEVGPLVAVFADAAVGDQYFDAVSPTLLVPLDNRVVTLRAGVGFSQGSVFTSEVSVGKAFIDYADGSLADTEAWVANAALSFTPDETLSLSAGLDTSLGPSGVVAGDTDAEYGVTGNGSYRLNSSLTLRGSAGASLTHTLGAGGLTLSYEAGVGIDLATTAHSVWSADYGYNHDGGAPEDTHRVTLGLLITR